LQRSALRLLAGKQDANAAFLQKVEYEHEEYEEKYEEGKSVV